MHDSGDQNINDAMSLIICKILEPCFVFLACCHVQRKEKKRKLAFIFYRMQACCIEEKGDDNDLFFLFVLLLFFCFCFYLSMFPPSSEVKNIFRGKRRLRLNM